MNIVTRRVLGRLYVGITLFCVSLLILQGVRHSPWYAERLYRQLLAGTEDEQLRAASGLAQVGAEAQLVRALQAEEPRARDLAQRGLEFLWFNAAGARAYRLLETAFAAANAGQPRRALAILNDLTARFPAFAEGWSRRASVHWRLGHYEQSQADCERALALNPLHYGAWQGIGLCQLQNGDLAGACRSLRAALHILPHDEATRASLRQCEELLHVPPIPASPARGDDLI
ncbi:MAG: tetratricopeptide repeat protein [Verrucomicrobia bacterium]|nr:tetratricopeptide repeat protein [Verrucomicrobiota bacterium]